MSEESYIQNLFAERIGGKNYGKSTAIYKFEKIKRAKTAAKAARPDVELIDMGVGEPDRMAFPPVLAELNAAAAKPGNRGYADNGDARLKEAAAWYMENVCGVPGIDPATQVIHSIGNKAALSILPAALINPGDVVLMTVPGYPVFGTHAEYYGGEVYNMALTEDRHYLPDLDAIPLDILERAKVMVLNYPNNPTGAAAAPSFFAEIVDFAKKYDLVVINDFAYAGCCFEGKPQSFLSTPGALDVGVELHSTSKNFNMTGWRCGFVVGNPLLVKAYGDVKDNTDSGQFLAIQHAAAYAFEHPELAQDVADHYSRRFDMLVPALNKLGFRGDKPGGTFFFYTAAPKKAVAKEGGAEVAFASGEAFSQWMITENLISTVPWDNAGAYVRFSVTFAAKDIEDEKRVVAEIEKRLSAWTYSWE